MNRKKIKWAIKTFLAVAAMLIGSLAVLIALSILCISKEMTDKVNDEFSGFSAQNGIIRESLAIPQRPQKILKALSQMLVIATVSAEMKTFLQILPYLQETALWKVSGFHRFIKVNLENIYTLGIVCKKKNR
ncbi:hypothetical protein [Anaeropeptidivorans aminofermentans]|uniref:hypothetical protein n=1 Tax=Anaeropeptidivorans aminofermentans TaxID=2934315 RepID=UPI002023F728|nr:hypothetical protein [Anaeropeptidivorans aminofermentans]